MFVNGYDAGSNIFQDGFQVATPLFRNKVGLLEGVMGFSQLSVTCQQVRGHGVK